MSDDPARSIRHGLFLWPGLSRGGTFFYVAVLTTYAVATITSIVSGPHQAPDQMMVLARQILHGHLDSPAFQGLPDSVEIAGRYYMAIGPLQVLPYLPFVLLRPLQGWSAWIASFVCGSAAAILALPLARLYGARGAAAYWVATFAAFGSLLLLVSASGNFYYLAHAESFLALTVFLIEWAGRRRPVVLGSAMAFSFLARPTTLLAVVPFACILMWEHREAIFSAFRSAVVIGIPIAVAIAAYGWFNWARFGSPLESGYAISYLYDPSLVLRRQLGLFSIVQVPENLRLAFLAPFQPLGHFPFFTANPYGLSMLLVSPALLTAAWAGVHDRGAQLLWIAAGMVAIPVFMYYGGGYYQYGFRYSMDFTPFLIALVAMGSSKWKGLPERLLIVLSIVSVTYGMAWNELPALRH